MALQSNFWPWQIWCAEKGLAQIQVTPMLDGSKVLCKKTKVATAIKKTIMVMINKEGNSIKCIYIYIYVYWLVYWVIDWVFYHVFTCKYINICMHACMHAGMNVCMYVCIYVCMIMYVWINVR